MLTNEELDKHTEWIVEQATKEPKQDLSHLKDVMDVVEEDKQDVDIVEKHEKWM